ncbi:ABC transporter substrate-binding protein [Pseudaminobacter sp. 19-2017]|uniref:ABC transporter substrate-binding protein n=1 Tax=Pseudaminobacter soli (ex Zhang et al. 2022) TaxID=2831468 RepID=A0A942E7R7_9HYPH|nr:ABC transporter substrate-binding protein [Pseudaminobacter soli]MBS3652496.1 ABC transporter substrate-binding protein [Pseudaminobacter soli]
MNFEGLIAGTIAGLVLAAGSAQAQQAENKLRWSSTVSITAPDPYYNFHREAMILNGQLVWDTLIYRNPQTGEYEPLLATSWKWIDDVTLEFVLREDVKFHDGRSLTSKDVVYTYNYISDPANKINVQSNVNWIKNAEEIDEKTVRLNLKSAFPPALEYVASLHAILPDGFFGNDGKAGSNGGLIGTGPYKFDEFVPGSTMQLSRWDGYFDGSPKGKPNFSEVEYRAIPDPSTQMAELLSGGLDWIWYVPKDQAGPLSTMPGVVVNPAETMRISFLSYNVRDMEGGNPLQDIRVRQAIAHAIDRDTIVKQVVGQGSTAITAPCFRTQFGCQQEVTQHPYDPEKAKALLAEAGYADGVTLDLVANSSRDRAWVESVAGYLSAVGIKTNVQLLQYAAASERMASNRTHLFMGDWGSYGINDVSALLNNFFTFTPDDMARDETVSNALKAAAATIDKDTRIENYDVATKRIAEQVYWHPLWTNPTTYAHQADLEFQAFPDENPRFFQVKWKD